MAANTCDPATSDDFGRAVKDVESALAGLDKLIEHFRLDQEVNDGQIELLTKLMWVMRNSQSLSAVTSRLSLAQLKLVDASLSVIQQVDAAQRSKLLPAVVADDPSPAYTVQTLQAILGRREEQRRRSSKPGSVRVLRSQPSLQATSSIEVPALDEEKIKASLRSSISSQLQNIFVYEDGASRSYAPSILDRPLPLTQIAQSNSSSAIQNPMARVVSRGSMKSCPSRSGSLLSMTSTQESARTPRGDSHRHTHRNWTSGRVTPPPLSPSSTISQPYSSPPEVHGQLYQPEGLSGTGASKDQDIPGVLEQNRPLPPLPHENLRLPYALTYEAAFPSHIPLDADNTRPLLLLDSTPPTPLGPPHIASSLPQPRPTGIANTSLQHTASNRIVTNTTLHMRLSSAPEESSEDGGGVMVDKTKPRPVGRSRRPLRSAASRQKRD